jgi:hypothetical protein
LLNFYFRGAVHQQSIPAPQSISQLRTGPVHQMPTPQAIKPSFALPSQVIISSEIMILFNFLFICSLKLILVVVIIEQQCRSIHELEMKCLIKQQNQHICMLV